jgi:hypothetical protein
MEMADININSFSGGFQLKESPCNIPVGKNKQYYRLLINIYSPRV